MEPWISIPISLLALGISIWTWKSTHKVGRYEKADELLLEIHKIELEHPEFHNPEWCKQALNHNDLKIRGSYDVFACIVWNFLETLYNRFGEKDLRKSAFYPAMKELSRQHREWFLKEPNVSSYNRQLIKFLLPKESGNKGI
ncbi:MAG: hypothetical protein AABZ27_02095 [Candidatus Omnitrophota bacterium]